MFYTVQQGDTLYGISRQFDVTVDEIIKLNNLSSTSITVGDKLKIPSDSSTYIVVKGDSLYSIGNKFGVSVDEIKKYNGLTTDNLSIGQVINIPVNINDGVDDSESFYIVKKGDTLYSISKMFNISVDELKRINNLNSNSLKVGDKLIVSLNNYDNYYIVKKGDTLYSIAKKFGISVDCIIENNNLGNANLTVGQSLYMGACGSPSNNIPIGSECFGNNFQGIEYITYIVKKGDNLYKIGKMYGVSADSIKKLNNLSSDNLSVGQELKIKEVV